VSGADVTFEGVTAKLARAMEHLETLENWMLDYLVHEPYQISVETVRSDSAYIVTVTQTPPPPRASAVFGDMIHNMRASLDHFARQLVIAHGGTPVDEAGGTTFPILDRRQTKPLDIRPYGCIPAAAREALDAAQPYRLGDDFASDPLYRLNLLDNIDKHRLLHLTALRGGYNAYFAPRAVRDTEGFAIPADARQYLISLSNPEPQRVVVHPDDVHDDATVTGQVGSELVLAEGSIYAGTNVAGVGRQLYFHLREVFDRFKNCF
jgi:hypothetical protein